MTDGEVVEVPSTGNHGNYRSIFHQLLGILKRN